MSPGLFIRGEGFARGRLLRDEVPELVHLYGLPIAGLLRVGLVATVEDHRTRGVLGCWGNGRVSLGDQVPGVEVNDEQHEA